MPQSASVADKIPGQIRATPSWINATVPWTGHVDGKREDLLPNRISQLGSARRVGAQFSAGLSRWSITNTSTGPLTGTSLKPSCS
jgi:hypothetical protein